MAEAIAKVPGISGTGALLTLADGRLTVRLTRDIWKLEPSYLELVRTVSVIARNSVRYLIGVPCRRCNWPSRRDAMDVGFWRAVLGCIPMADDNAVDPLGHGSVVSLRLAVSAAIVEKDVEASWRIPECSEKQRELPSVVDAVDESMVHQVAEGHRLLWSAGQCELHKTVEVAVTQC